MSSSSRQVTVQDLWSLALPPGTELLAGAAGLGGAVEWITSLRAAYPLFGALGPGYVALARLSLARDLDARLTPSFLVRELCRASAAGLVLDERPDDPCLTLAEQRRLPLMLLPEGSDLHQVERELLRSLVDFQGQVARKEAEARIHFQGGFAQGGLDAVLSDLAQRINGAVALTTGGGQTWCEADQRDDLVECQETVYPARVGGRLLGQLIVKSCKAHEDPLDAVLARAAAEVCAIELLQRLTRREIEAELGVDLVEQLLGKESEIRAASQRMERLGYAIAGEREHIVIAAPLSSVEKTPERPPLLGDIAWAARRDGAATLHVSHDDAFLLFVALQAPSPARGIQRWLKEASSRREGNDAVGVSRPVRSWQQLGQAARQAMDALTLGLRIDGKQGPYYYDELGLYRVLVELRDRVELRRFYDETLGDLLAYDAAHGTELVETLRVFFEEHTNVSQAARALFVHRNTLNYRLQRIVEIAGIDLNDAETRLALQLALKVHQLVEV